MSSIHEGKIIRAKVVLENNAGEQIRSWGGSRIHLSGANDTGKCLVVQKASHRKGAGTFFDLRKMQRLHARSVPDGRMTIETSHRMQKKCYIHITVKEEDIPDLKDLYRIIARKEMWSRIGVPRPPQEVSDNDDEEDVENSNYLL